MSTERLDYRDSELLQFSATVVAVEGSGDRTLIETDRTAFYPTSGGQPHDTGYLGDAKVIEVVDQDGRVVHIVEGESESAGQSILGRIDGARRRDHMQQHSGQHILSQAFEHAAGLRTVSFHLGTTSCTIDLDRARVSEDEIRRAERLAQSVVLDDRPILTHFSESDDLERFGLRKPTDRLGTIRIIEIEDFDVSACGGTHVKRTGQVGPIKIRRTERRGTTTRVDFLCGWRALDDYRGRLDSSRSIAERLSVADGDIAASVQKLADDHRALQSLVAELRDAALVREADDLLRAARVIQPEHQITLVRGTFVDRPQTELRQLALAVVARSRSVVFLGSAGSSGSLVFAQTEGLPFDVGGILRQVSGLVGARGGGTRNLAQGGGPGAVSVTLAIEAAERLLLHDCADTANVP